MPTREPRFRYWGNIDPRSRQRVPVLNAVPEAAIDDNGRATLRIYDPIDSWGGYWGVSAKEILDALDALPDNVTGIDLHLNSPGGEVFEGIAILNALRNHAAPVTAIVDGLAASAASFLAVGSDEVVMGRNTTLMIHDAWGIAMGPAADMHAMGDLLDKLSNNIAGIYQAKAGGTLEDWRDAMLAESWYLPDEAVEAGLADRVDDGGGEEQPDETVEDRFDLSVFQHGGRRDAPAPVVPAAARTSEQADRASRYRARRHAENARRLGVPA
jgi:ATP-dependent protease ClpP protease subunit